MTGLKSPLKASTPSLTKTKLIMKLRKEKKEGAEIVGITRIIETAVLMTVEKIEIKKSVELNLQIVINGDLPSIVKRNETTPMNRKEGISKDLKTGLFMLKKER